MKTKKKLSTVLALCITLLLTACAGNETTEPESTPNAAATADTAQSANGADAKLDDLYQQENQLFADHKDVWDKVFGMMNKSSADPNGNYADYLAGTVTSNKDSFTDEELQTLNGDIETIRGIEDQIAALENSTASDDTAATGSSSDTASPFSNFSGTDYDGNTADGSLFAQNAVTVVNFWFTGCKPCVAELSKLNELNETLKSMGGEVIGINTETFDGNEDAIKEAKAVLESQGAGYRNFSIDSASDTGRYASDIMAFPTTILVDRNGNIVGDPLLGGIDNQDNYDALMKQIQAVADADSTDK